MKLFKMMLHYWLSTYRNVKTIYYSFLCFTMSLFKHTLYKSEPNSGQKTYWR